MLFISVSLLKDLLWEMFMKRSIDPISEAPEGDLGSWFAGTNFQAALWNKGVRRTKAGRTEGSSRAVAANPLKLHVGDIQMPRQILTVLLLCPVAEAEERAQLLPCGDCSVCKAKGLLWALICLLWKHKPHNLWDAPCWFWLGFHRSSWCSLAYLRFTAVSESKRKRYLWLSSARRVLT